MNKKSTKILKVNLLALTMCCFMMAHGQSVYVTGDFHQHTTYTDGSYTFGHMMDKNAQFGLDWWANSEHGGGWNRWSIVSGIELGTEVVWENTGIELKGNNVANGNMWRWQSLTEWAFRDLQMYRRIYPNKLIIQAYEMNVPGHEHASLGLIGNQFNTSNPNVTALAQFEYLFDATDLDDSQPLGVTNAKMMTNNHAKAVAAATWLQTHYPTQSWFIPAHPERFRYPSGTANYEGWNIEHFRDMNNAAPDVFFGFESFPGHQASPNRCEYHKGRGLYGSYGICTYGGCGWMSAKVGGLWDALLSEGRHFWLFANSDCHLVTNADGTLANADFYPGEYQKTYTSVSEKNNPQAVVDGLRSGNSWVVSGDLIDELEFKIENAVMGQITRTAADGTATITVRVHNPQTANNNTYSDYKIPQLDHFDIIEGVVGEKVTPPATVPEDGITGYSAEYKNDEVTTTKVIARFGKTAAGNDPNGTPTTLWTNEGNGYISASFEINIPEEETRYYRLRGSNIALGTLNEMDAAGNPLPDTLKGTNTAALAFDDLWFYSNPVYAANKELKIAQHSVDHSISIYPNPANNQIYITGANINEIRIFNILGVLVEEKQFPTLSSTYNVDVNNLANGIYTVQIKTNTGSYVTKKFVKQ
jgi:hypothetical protein